MMLGKILGKKPEKERDKPKGDKPKKDGQATKKKATGPGFSKDTERPKPSTSGSKTPSKKPTKPKAEGSKSDGRDKPETPSSSSNNPCLSHSFSNLSSTNSISRGDVASPKPSPKSPATPCRPPLAPKAEEKKEQLAAPAPFEAPLASRHSGSSLDQEAPEEFICPLSLEIMYDPVIVSSGQTYDRAFIMSWIEHGHATCPKTRQPLDAEFIFPDQVLKMMIEDWCKQNGVPLLTPPKVVTAAIGMGNLAPADRSGWPGPLAMQVQIFQNIRRARDGVAASPRGESRQSDADRSSTSDTVAVNWTDTDPGSASGRTQGTEASESGGSLRRDSTMSSESGSQGIGDSSSFSQSYIYSDSSSQATDLKMPDVLELVDALKSDAIEEQAAAVALLRVMTRYRTRLAETVARAGAIVPLIQLMKSDDEPTQEHAVTTLLNLCLNEDLKPLVRKEPNVIPYMVHVLNQGMPQARGNSAAALYLLSTLDGVREEVQGAGALPGLIQLLDDGAPQAKKDAANCLLSLALAEENRREIAQSGVVQKMCSLLQYGEDEVEEQTAALCASLVRDPEGCGIMFEEGAIEELAELVVVGGTMRCREYAVSSLLGLALHSDACLAAIQEEWISVDIGVLTRTGSTKTQAEATALFQLLLTHGEGE